MKFLGESLKGIPEELIKLFLSILARKSPENSQKLAGKTLKEAKEVPYIFFLRDFQRGITARIITRTPDPISGEGIHGKPPEEIFEEADFLE